MLCTRNHISILNILINHGANVNTESKKRAIRPLDVIAGKKEEMFEVFKFLLLEKKAEIQSRKGAKVLVSAAERGHLNIVNLLLPKMTRLRQIQREALEAAVRCEHVDVAKAILEDGTAKANPSGTESSLLEIANSNKQTAMITLLKRFGAKGTGGGRVRK